MALMNATTYVGVGLYTYPEAARIIGITPEKLRRWARDYYYTSHGQRYRHTPVIERAFPDDPVLTFRELIELLFVRLFRSEGVSMEVIRRASDRAAELFATPYPFTLRRFDTDGKHIFATLGSESESPEMLAEISRGQLAFERVVRPFFRKLEYGEDSDALLLWPRDRDGRIVIDPDRQFGKPIDAETGVPTEVLAAAARSAGEDRLDAVADWFRVPIDAVTAAIAYEQSPSVV